MKNKTPVKSGFREQEMQAVFGHNLIGIPIQEFHSQKNNDKLWVKIYGY